MQSKSDSIDELRLSTRCRNALRQAGITSVEMLENALSKSRLKYLPGVGIGCLREIERELERRKIKDFHLVGCCFFCDKSMIASETKLTLEEREALSRALGTQPNRLGGTIGKYKICKDCVSELQNILGLLE